MHRNYRLTTAEYQTALEKAARDDERFPNLRRHQWLVNAATVKDGEVILKIDDPLTALKVFSAPPATCPYCRSTRIDQGQYLEFCRDCDRDIPERP